MSLSGSIEDLPLLEILQVVSFCQKTGHLVVRAPGGEAGVVFRDGRVVAGYGPDMPAFDASAADREGQLRTRLAALLQRLVRLREGEFAFNLAEQVPARLEGRDLSPETLDYGINPEELMLELARQLDEERRDCAAALEASFVAPAEPSDDALPMTEAAAGLAVDARSLEPGPPELELELELEPEPEPELEIAPDELAPEEDPADEVELEPIPEGAATTAVLLVDDEPDVRRVVGERLERAGHAVVRAASIDEARLAMARLSSTGRPLLLAVDLGLPSDGGTTFRGGLDVVRHARALQPGAPVLLMAETIDEKLRARAKRLGVSLLAFKPWLSKLDPLQYEADLRAFGDKLAADLLPRLEGRKARPAADEAARGRTAGADGREEELRRALAEVEAHPDPDLVAFLLLRAARAYFPRVVLFVAKDDRLRGLAGFGRAAGGRSVDALARELVVPLEAGSRFGEVVASGRAWQGTVPGDGPLRALVDRIGGFQARAAALVPLRAAHETIALLYGDAPDGDDLPSVAPFARFAARAGRALEETLAARRATLAAAS